VLHTPGHTPESISFLLTDTPASSEPVMIFTGDFVFVGDIGRPDLLEKAAGLKGTQDEGALQMYQSIQKFSKLPDFIQVWPGHGAGSACGKALGAVPSSTVGYEKIRNWAFQYKKNKKGFIDFLLADEDLTRKLMRIGLDNILGYIPSPEVFTKTGGKLKKAKVINLKTFKELKKIGTPIVDLRGAAEFNEGHIKGAKNVFVGTIENNLDKIDKKKKVVIHCQSGARAAIAYSVLAKNGYDKIVNYSGGINEWIKERNIVTMG